MDQLSAHLDRAWDLVSRGDLAGARRSAETSLEKDAESPEVHNLLGWISAAEGRADEAIEHYRQAIELDESFVEAMLNAAEVYLHPLRDWDGAIEMIEEALDWIEEDQELADAMLLKVDALLGKGDRQGALAELARVPQAAIDANPGLRFAVGRALFDMGEKERAAPLIASACEVPEARTPESFYYLGLVCEWREDLRGAAIAFLQSRDADLRSGPPPGSLPPEQFEKRVQSAIRQLPADVARVIEGALVIVGDMPGAEVVAEGVDPRISVLVDDVSDEGATPHAGRVFVYQRNVERMARDAGEIEEEIVRALGDEVRHVFPDLPPRSPADLPN